MARGRLPEASIESGRSIDGCRGSVDRIRSADGTIRFWSQSSRSCTIMEAASSQTVNSVRGVYMVLLVGKNLITRSEKP